MNEWESFANSAGVAAPGPHLIGATIGRRKEF
jgi:hypothetical protein